MANLKVPPHSDELEKTVLGSLLIDKDAIHTVSSVLKSTDFYNDQHKLLYSIMLSLYERQLPLDIVTVTSELKKTKLKDTISRSYIEELIDAVPTSANVEQYSKLIKDNSIKRALIHAGGKITELGFSNEDTKEVLNRAESEVFAISQGNTLRGFTPLKDTLAKTYESIVESSGNKDGMRGIKSGFSDLDSLLAGFQDANLIILAARPGQGKTAMAVNIAQFVGVNQKIPVGVFSLEMSQEELADRLVVGQSDIDAWKLKTRKLSADEMERVTDSMGLLAEAPIFIDDTPGTSVSEMRTKARRLQLEYGLRFLIVDYLQLVDPGRRYDSRVQEVSVVSQALKNLARELKIPVLALSQLSRAVEHRGEKKPQLADLRESGAIEQDADVVLFLYRMDDQVTPTMATKLLIAKHRNGPTGEIDLLFKGDRIRFYNLEKKREGG